MHDDDDVAQRHNWQHRALNSEERKMGLKQLGLGKNQILIFGLFWLKKSENQRKIRIKIN